MNERSGQRVSSLFGTTLREAPGEVEIESHSLLLRAGYVRQLATGIYSYLPLAWRSLRKIHGILREEMDRIGGQELSLPVVHPAELWQSTGRWSEIDDTMARFQDRRGRDMLLAMTHEEVVAFHAASEILSYRQLPSLIYQVQTKFRDELRSRGGLIRVREFLMKDSYSLDRDAVGMERQYGAHFEVYERIGRRADLPLTAVRSDAGMMGGNVAHEFMYVTPFGEDSLVLCDACGYAANREVAEFETEIPARQPAPIQRVSTPGASTIDALAEMLDVEATDTAKMVFYSGRIADSDRLIVAIVRGDMEANPVRVQQLAGATRLRPAREDEIRASGMEPGYASPVGIEAEKAIFVVDHVVAATANLLMGANQPDVHLKNVCCGRDYEADVVGSVALAFESASCAGCGAPLRMARGVEVGNIFQLGTRYSEGLGATFTDEGGAERPIWMGSYGIGLGRLLACVAEEHRDDRGLALPVSVAPYQVSLVSLARGDEAHAATERMFDQLVAAGIEVLFDDRRELSAGVKLNDTDLRGMPIRLIVGERSLEAGGLELSLRSGPDGAANTPSRIVALDEAVEVVRFEVEELFRPLRP